MSDGIKGTVDLVYAGRRLSDGKPMGYAYATRDQAGPWGEQHEMIWGKQLVSGAKVGVTYTFDIRDPEFTGSVVTRSGRLAETQIDVPAETVVRWSAADAESEIRRNRKSAIDKAAKSGNDFDVLLDNVATVARGLTRSQRRALAVMILEQLS